MKKTISLLILAIFATSTNGNVMFSDDFESGSLGQWIIGGRQQDDHGGINIAEVIYRNSSQMAHIHHSLDTTEITLEKLLEYCPNLIFNFDMEVSVSSIAGPTDDDYAMGGAFFDFLDSSGELIGSVRYIGSTSSYPFTIGNPSPSREYIALPDSSPHSYSFTLEDILSHITVDTDSIAYINFSFWAYNSGFGWNMSADVWVDNVVVSVPELLGLEIVGPDEVAENFSASYKAVAYYDNDSTRDVTYSALWAVEPNTAANIDENGVLRTKDIVKHRLATILASYIQGDVTVEAEKAIDILAICPTGIALRLDGVDDYVDFSRNIITTTEFTVSAWANHYGSPGGSSPVNAIFQQRDDESRAGYAQSLILLATEYPGDYAAAIIRSSGGSSTQSLTYPKKNYNQWHHYAMIVDSIDFTFYIDGVEVDRTSNNQAGDYVTSIDYVSIGRHSYRGANRGLFNGAIDEVAIYNRALSAEEIRANMHTRLAGDEPNLVGYWDFDEGEGQIVYDLSGNGNDGQLGVTADEDVSDPAWVESDAPVGICSLYQIATLAVGRAVECKTALIEKLLAALTEEWKAYEALEEWLESGDYGDLYKGDIVTAKQKIHSAIQHGGQQSMGALEKSVEKLKDALSALGYEPEPPSSNQRLWDLWGLEWTEPVPVMEVNTDFAEEWTPFLSFDGLTLYFARVRSDTFYYGRIFEATRDEPYGPFTSVKEIDGALNSSPGHVISPWVSPDNLRMYYYTELSAGWELKVTERASDNDPWPIGTNISELNVLGTRHQTPRLTANELTIFFSSRNMPGGYGGYDIWTATRPDRNSPFGAVRNLTEINTAWSDHAPFVSPDGLMLYFDSNRNGKFQLFRAARGSLNEPFGNIEHLSLFDTPEGISIHPCVSSDGTAIYFVRVVEGQHNIWVSYRIEDPYELAIIRTEDAIAQKAKFLERISAELEKEWAAYEALEELLESGDYGDLNKGDIVTAKQKIHSAIQHQEQTIDALEKSIEKLKDALNALGYEPEPPVPNQPPNVNITKPTEGAVFTPSQTIEIGANAWDVDGSVVKVEFFANGSKIGEDNDGADGWKTNWYDHPIGTYSLTAKATDNDGAATTSPAVGIIVHGAPPPPPPPPPPPEPPPPPGSPPV